MNLYSTPDARFWQTKLNPNETLLWIDRSQLTVVLAWPAIVAATPAMMYAGRYLYKQYTKGELPLHEIISDWQTYSVEVTMIAGLVYCFFYLFRFGILFPGEEKYAITDQRLMVWRKTKTPRLIEKEFGPSLELVRPRWPRKSVMFAQDALAYREKRNPFSQALDPKSFRRIGFVNPRNPEEMEQALTHLLQSHPQSRI